jgi:hypothetical protein
MVRRRTDDYPAAAQAQEQALGIYRVQRIGAAEAPTLLVELDALTGPSPAQ